MAFSFILPPKLDTNFKILPYVRRPSLNNIGGKLKFLARIAVFLARVLMRILRCLGISKNSETQG